MIYYIACTATERLKIGYTRGEPEVRLKQLQTGSAAVRLIACHDGSIETEKWLHGQFAEERLRGEWFKMSARLLEHVSLVVWLVATDYAMRQEQPPDWIRVGLRAMNDGATIPLPDRLAAFL